MPTKEAIWVLGLLAEAIELWGVPHELMSDNGTPFVTTVRTMLSRFQRSLAELSIRHIRTRSEGYVAQVMEQAAKTRQRLEGGDAH